MNPNVFNAEDVESKIVVKGYTWSRSRYHYVAFVLENNSDFMIQLDLQAIFKNSEGGIIGAKNDDLNAFEPRTQSVLLFSNDDAFSSVDYRITVTEETYYKGVISAIELDVSTTSGKAIISGTNNGNIAAKFVQYTVLFFSGDNVVDYGWGYLTDSDSEIKPGRMEIKEESTRESFDTVAVFLSGRGDR